MAASDGNISERLKSVDILERFKAVIFQSGGSLCYAGWLAAPSPRYCVYLSILLTSESEKIHHELVFICIRTLEKWRYIYRVLAAKKLI